MINNKPVRKFNYKTPIKVYLQKKSYTYCLNTAVIV